MAWTDFHLGRPGYELAFTIRPESLDIDYSNMVIVNQNIAGDTKQSIVKSSVPTIQLRANYLSMDDRNKLASLRNITDTLLSFKCRDDWKNLYERVSIIDSTHVQLANTSATRLSEVMVGLGLTATITISTMYTIPPSYAGAGTTFDPGATTYDSTTRIITLTNALSSLTDPFYVTTIYTGWLVRLAKVSAANTGGLVDYSNCDVQLIGA